MLNKLEIKALLRAYQTPDVRLAKTKVAEKLADELGFGRIVGKLWVLSAKDRQAIGHYLKNVERVDPNTNADAWADADRIVASRLGANEKLAGRRPRDGRIAIRAPQGLTIDGKRIDLPGDSFLDLRLDNSLTFGHDALVVVENFEAFVHWEEADVSIPYTSPLLIYRGDSIHRQSAVNSFVANCGINVSVFPDFDPAGIAIASSISGCQAIIAPTNPAEALAQCGRGDLFTTQAREVNMISKNEWWIDLMSALQRAHRGLDQESMIAQRVPLSLWRKNG